MWWPALLSVCWAPLVAQESDHDSHPLLASLERRVEEDPLHADSWRLLAKLQYQSGDTAQAIAHLKLALEIDPQLVAAHFDYGQILAAQGDIEAARHHYELVHALAPESSYAEQIRAPGTGVPKREKAQGRHAPPKLAQAADATSVSLAGFEIQTFDGTGQFDRQLETLYATATQLDSRWRAYVEMGALYNTNVSLTPISRQLENVDASAFQGFLNPEVEYLILHGQGTRSGPLTRGYFAVNEDHQSQFNLASFQGGWFAERDLSWWGRDTIGRVDYLYALDIQGTDRFGDRHSLHTSATSLLDSGDILYLFGIWSFSNFDEDGLVPELDSLDGPGLMGGISRYFQTDWQHLTSFRLGANLSSANTEGADTRYIGAALNSGATVRLNARWRFEPEVGIGFRSYYDFTGPVNRDETVIRAAWRLSRQLTDRASVAMVFGYDRFASDNENFAAERTEGGLVSTWIY